MAIRVYEPEVVTRFLSPRTSGAYFMNNRYKLWFHSYMYICLVHDNYHIEQVPSVVECVDRGCGNSKQSKRSYECNAFTADLKIAFDINTSGG